LSRADFKCESCWAEDKTLHVHHKLYRKKAEPWEYADHELIALCEDCHETDHYWRQIINEALARLPCGTLEQIAGYIEAVAAEGEAWELEPPKEKFLRIRSYEHADGVADAFRLEDRRRAVDRLCEIIDLSSLDVVGLAMHHTFPPGRDDAAN